MLSTLALAYIAALHQQDYTVDQMVVMVKAKFDQDVTKRSLYRAIKKIKEENIQPAKKRAKSKKTEAAILAEEALSRGIIDKALINVADEISVQKRNETLIKLSDLVLKAIDIKGVVLSRLKESLELKDPSISIFEASRIINNLGLNSLNVAKMLGVQVDGTQNIQMKAEGVDEKGEDNQVKFYLPDNNR